MRLAGAAIVVLLGLMPVAQAPAPPEEVSRLRARAEAALSQTTGEIGLAGLEQPVEVIRDRWGIPHIYARTVRDLFFAQGFVAAQDRLWQLDLWRRMAEGTLAEIVGPTAVNRDILARLLRLPRRHGGGVARLPARRQRDRRGVRRGRERAGGSRRSSAREAADRVPADRGAGRAVDPRGRDRPDGRLRHDAQRAHARCSARARGRRDRVARSSG